MNIDLRNRIADIVDGSDTKRTEALEALLEVMVHTALAIPAREHVTQEARRTAYRALTYLIESKLEANIEKSWHHQKFERLLKGAEAV